MCLGWGNGEAHAKASVFTFKSSWKLESSLYQTEIKKANKPPSKFCFACAIECYIFLFPDAFLVLSSTTCGQKLFEQITGFFSLILACIQTAAPHTVDLSPLGHSGIDVASMTH